METTTAQILIVCAFLAIAIVIIIRRMATPREEHYQGPAILTYRFDGEDREGDWLCQFTDNGKIFTALVYLKEEKHKVGDIIEVENLGYGSDIPSVSATSEEQS